MPALVVEVVGDTSGLTKELTKAEAQLKRFAGRASSWDKRRAETGPLGGTLADVRKAKAESTALGQSLEEMGTSAEATGGSLARMGTRLGAVGIAAGVGFEALNKTAAALKVTGDEAFTTEGKFRNLGAELLSGHLIAGIEALAVHAPTATEKLDALRKSADASYDDFIRLKSGAEQSADSIEQVRRKMEAAGTGSIGFRDQLVKAENQLREAAGGARDYAAALIAADQATQSYEATLRHAGSEAARFGEKVRGAGDVAANTPLTTSRGGPGRAVAPHVAAPLTPEQRRAFFDTRIAREIDRTQDIKTVQGQAAALRAIAAEIQKRIDATDDATRRLNLEDQRVAVLRRAQDLVDRAAADAAAAAAKAAREREQALKQAAVDAQKAEAARLDWLDFALEKAEDTKTHKDDLKALRDRETFLKLMIRKEGETLDRVRELWRTRKQIRDLNKSEADVDPLAGLMQVSSKRLTGILAAGTGLDAAGRRVLGANIAGAEIQPLYVSVQIDGREIGRAVTKDQSRTSARTAKQTSGFRG
jgi:hypothetical protein